MATELMSWLGKRAGSLQAPRAHAHSRTVAVRSDGATTAIKAHMDGRGNAQPPHRYGRKVNLKSGI